MLLKPLVEKDPKACSRFTERVLVDSEVCRECGGGGLCVVPLIVSWNLSALQLNGLQGESGFSFFTCKLGAPGVIHSEYLLW
jgi:hypothetical protein